MSWRTLTDWAKRSPATLRAADWLGRGRGRLRWLDHLNPPIPSPSRPDLRGWADHELAAAWIGHATILLRIGERTILTDPVFANRIGLGLGFMTGGPRRHIAPAVALRKLPPLDLILISHAHFDHLDRPTLDRLNKNTPVVTASSTSDLIRDLGFRRISEIRWGESLQFGPLKLTAWKTRHWGARSFFDLHRGYNAYVLETDHHRVLYGADTAYQEDFKPIGKVDLAILGIGAYDPYIQAHANPEQAWTMADHVRADFVFPMHHSTFRLSHEPMQEPLLRILTAAGRSADRIIAHQVGDTWTLKK